MKKEVKNVKNILWIVMGFVLFFYPLWTTGVIHNDEMLLLFSRNKGYSGAVIYGLKTELSQGRILRMMASVNQSIGFLTQNMMINRIIQSVLILISIILVTVFVYKVMESARSAAITGLMCLVFLPYTFEGAVPGSYVGLTVIPMIEILLSAILYVNYLHERKRFRLIASVVLYIFALLGYEFVLTFILIFPILFLTKGNPKQNRKEFLKHIILYGVIGMMYLAIMFGFKKFFPGNYDGTVIEISSIESMWNIVKHLVKSSIPGYFLFSDKYRWLFRYHSGSDLLGWIKQVIFGERLLSLRIILVMAWLLISFINIEKIEENRLEENRDTFKIGPLLFWGGCYIILPTLPNSISKVYQGNVGETGFVSLPINYFVFFVIVILISGMITKIQKRIPIKAVYFALIGVVYVGGIAVQIMNEEFMKQSEKDYTRYSLIEQVMKTEEIREFNNKRIYAPDLYETRHTLAIRDGYWTSYATQYCSLNVEVVKEYEACDAKIFYLDDRYICAVDEKQVFVFSNEKLQGMQLVQIDQNEYAVYEFDEYIEDDGIYIYSIARGDD